MSLKTEQRVIKISKAFGEQLWAAYAAQRLAEGDPIQTVVFETDRYIVTGIQSDTVYHLSKVVPVLHYGGDLKPLAYADHWQDVNAGNRRRSYVGMSFMSRGSKWVVVESEVLRAEIDGAAEQMSLFD